MPANSTHTIVIVTACMRPDGTPAFARTEVAVTDDQADNGIHYYLAEAELLEQGYEEPMVHFTLEDAPAFLFSAVEECLAVASAVNNLTLSEGA
ncbi:MAG: hypothetical protein FJ271_27780 [Planctomycetes bacterium]|nr:hypothetical protein [Planctomycetota bacterium]